MYSIRIIGLISVLAGVVPSQAQQLTTVTTSQSDVKPAVTDLPTSGNSVTDFSLTSSVHNHHSPTRTGDIGRGRSSQIMRMMTMQHIVVGVPAGTEIYVIFEKSQQANAAGAEKIVPLPHLDNTALDSRTPALP